MSSVLSPSQLVVLVAIIMRGASAAKWMEAAMPLQTAQVVNGGIGLPIYEAMPMATPPPVPELVKRRLDARALAATNTCAEWTILGEDNGQPVCSNSETCIFSTVGSLRYEGCGKPNLNYDWITECHPYPTTAPTGASKLHCPSALPSCAVFQFIFSAGITYSNYGCGTSAYTLVATLLDSTGRVPAIELPKTSTVDPLQPSKPSGGKPTASPTNLPTKSPLSVYIGGAVGGVAVLAAIGVLVWYCMRKRKREKMEGKRAADAATEVAYHNSTHMAEMEGGEVGKNGFGVVSPASSRGFFAPGKPGEGLSPPPLVFGELDGRGWRVSELESRPSTAGRVEMGEGNGNGNGNVVGEMGSVQKPAVVKQRVGMQQRREVDMNGAPMSNEWKPQ